ncbi:response regulator [Maribacter halichondriae]|uniref:response regulator n=1 Tax=Maribacter halichondriae TaxID=2980554 RepID=UPI0023584DF8|nr:response regulator [Maribacter sp. Hal144]
MVEDDEHIQTVILKMLIDVGFFQVEMLNDGADVMKELVNNPYDLVLMDIDLPNVSGDHLTSLIRDFPFKNIKRIPVIGLTANAFPEQVQTYRNSGMNEVVTKPFEKEDLLKTIFRMLK